MTAPEFECARCHVTFTWKPTSMRPVPFEVEGVEGLHLDGAQGHAEHGEFVADAAACPRCRRLAPRVEPQPEVNVILDEVKRLHLTPGDRLIVRTADTRLTAQWVHQYQESLQAAFPDNDVLVIVAAEIAIQPRDTAAA